jgi:hypothetical protein
MPNLNKNYRMFLTVYCLILGLNISLGDDTNQPKGLGLLQEAEKVFVRKSIVNTIVGLTFPANYSFNDVDEVLKKIIIEVNKLKEIPLMKTQSYYDSMVITFDAIDTYLDNLEKALFDITRFVDNTTQPTMTPRCHQMFTDIDKSYFEDLYKTVIIFMKKIDLTLDNTAVAVVTTGEAKLNSLVENIYHIKDAIGQIEDEVITRVKIMDNLANGIVPEHLPFFMDALSCLKSGNIETTTINYCDKNIHGLYCEVTVNVHKTIKEYTHYIPISYDNVQLKAENIHQLILRDDLGHWEVLECESDIDSDYDDDNVLENYLDCHTKLYKNKCTDKILTKDFEDILKHCNFTGLIEPQTVSRTKTGLLVMGEDLHVRELDPVDNHVRTTLPQQYPFHIVTNDNLAVTINDKETIYKPSMTNIDRALTYTYLTEDFIASMKSSAKYSDLLEDITLHQIFTLIFAFLFLITIPILLTLCCLSFKNSDHYHRWRDSRARKILKQTKKSAMNYRENKKLLRANQK